MRRFNVRFALLLALGCAALAGGGYALHGRQLQATSSILLTKADERLAAGHPSEAAAFLQRYVKLNPANDEALARLGTSWAEAGDYGRAFMMLDQALRRRQELRPERRLLVDVAMRIGRFSDAAEHLSGHLIPADPEDPELHDLLGQCQAALGGHEQAAGSLQRAIDLVRQGRAPRSATWDPAGAYVRLALLWLDRLEQPAAADDLLEQLVRDRPDSATAWLAQAQYLRRRLRAMDSASESRRAGIARAVEQALAIDPSHAEALALAAELEWQAGRWDRSREFLARGLEHSPGEQRWYQMLARVEAAAGHPDEALAVLRRGIKVLPGAPELQWALAERLIDDGQTDEAQALLVALRKQRRAPAPLDYLAAQIAAANGDWPAAVRLFEQARPALVAWPELSLQADYRLGQCYERLGNADQQLAAYRRAVDADRTWLAARWGLAAALVAAGRIDEAIDQYRQVAASANAPASAPLALTRLLFLRQFRLSPERRDWREVEELLATAELSATELGDVAILRAELDLAQGRPDAARARLAEACERQPQQLPLRLALAALEQRLRDFDAALRTIDAAEREFGDGVDVRLARLRLLIETHNERSPQALAALEIDWQTFPLADRSRLLGGLAAGHFTLGQTDEATRLWRQVCRSDPQNLAARLFLFDLALEAADDAELDELLSEIGRIEGADDGPMSCYGRAVRLLIARGDAPESLEEATGLLAKAAVRRPAWSRIPLLQARVSELQEDPQAAVDYYSRAIELGDRSPATVQRLVRFLALQGRYVEADQAIRKLEERQTPFTPVLGRMAAEVSLEVQDFGRAIDLARRVAEGSSDYRDQLWLGRLLRSRGEAESARAAFERAASLAPHEVEAWVELARDAAAAGEALAVDAVLERVAAEAPAERVPLFMGRCQAAIGSDEEAARQFDVAVQADAADGATLRAVADHYLRRGEVDRARPLLQRLVASDVPREEGDGQWARRNLAALLGATGGVAGVREGLALIEQNVEGSSASADDRRVHALLLAAGGRDGRASARAIVAGLLEQDPHSDADRFLLAQWDAAAGDWPQARRHLQSLLARRGDEPQFVAAYVDGLLRHDETTEAELWLQRLEALEPGVMRTWRLKGRLLVARGRVNEAIDLWESGGAVAVDRSAAAAALEELALSADAAGREQLLAAAERIYRGMSPSQPAALALGGFLARQGRTTEALRALEPLWQSGHVEAAAAHAVAALRGEAANDEDRRSVEAALRAAIAAHPDSLSLQLSMAQLHDARGRYDDARAAYEEVLARDGEQVEALNNLALLLALRYADSQAALALIDRAIQAAGPLAPLLDSRATVLLTLGRVAEAEADLAEALLDRRTPARLFHLAQVQMRQGDRAAAADVFRQAERAGLSAAALHPLERPGLGRLVEQLSDTRSAERAAAP